MYRKDLWQPRPRISVVRCSGDDANQRARPVLARASSLARTRTLAQRVQAHADGGPEEQHADDEIAEDPEDVGHRLEDRDDRREEAEAQPDGPERPEQCSYTRHFSATSRTRRRIW